MSRACSVLFATLFVVSSASAEVVGVDIDVHEDVLGGKSYGLAGPYEKFIGTMHFAVDPSNSANEIIVDIEVLEEEIAKGLAELKAMLSGRPSPSAMWSTFTAVGHRRRRMRRYGRGMSPGSARRT